MSVVKTFKTLEEILDACSPKTVCVLVEVTKGHTYDDVDEACKNVDKLDKLLSRIEDGMEVYPDITTILVFHRGIPMDQCQPIPVYSFVTPKTSWKDIYNCDLSFISRLDGKLEIVKAPDDLEIRPSTLID